MNQHISPQTLTVRSETQSAAVVPGTMIVQVTVVVAEILLVSLLLAGHAWQAVFMGHLAIVGILIMLIVALENARASTEPFQALALMTFAGGPIGAAAALTSAQQLWQPRGDALDRWYETIAPTQTEAVTLVDLILDGRLVREQSRLPRPYDALLESGTMQEKQALLAHLAVENDEKFVEVALALALRSSDQRVRVQAAAVAAHIKARNRLRARPASSVTAGPSRA